MTFAAAVARIGAGVVFFAGPAAADCPTSASPAEKVICADPALMAADHQLHVVIAATLGKLTPAGVTLLEESQKNWRTMTSDCLNRVESAGACLAETYRKRIGEIRDLPTRKGPFSFIPLEHDCIGPRPDPLDPDDPGGAPHRAVYPHIDQPQTPVTERWNQLVEADAAPYFNDHTCGEGDTETDLNFSFGLVNDRIISINWNTYEYGHGAAHGLPSGWAETIVLSPAPHPLRPEDLFRAQSAWHERLTALLLADVRQSIPTDMPSSDGAASKRLAQIAGDPKWWELDESGLTISFDVYELGAYGMGAPSFFYPWSMLSDIMNVDAPVP